MTFSFGDYLSMSIADDDRSFSLTIDELICSLIIVNYRCYQCEFAGDFLVILVIGSLLTTEPDSSGRYETVLYCTNQSTIFTIISPLK